jgi:hypothetical protein
MPQVVQSLKYVHGNSPVLHVLAHQVADVFAQATLALDVHSCRPPRSAQPGCVVLTLSQLKVKNSPECARISRQHTGREPWTNVTLVAKNKAFQWTVGFAWRP